MGMTAAEFTEYRERAKGMPLEQLLYAQRDARRAAMAFKGHNPPGAKGEGWYTDEACTYGDEIRRRHHG